MHDDSKDPVPLTPEAAAKLMADDPRAVLIDIRSTMEYLFVGHPVGAVHIPWIDEPDWKENPDFCTEVRKLLLGGSICDADSEAGCPPVILICRSGKRSLKAGRALIADGLSRVFHVESGFEGELDEQHHRSTINGWRHDGLPWEQC
ncbi:MAG: rhodanese-like domain-containing protein [Gammaproteobacteria bacterium]|nr:MAG: rhodanese-like domain-containing protein [Gammaproteobacteria bacterium]